MSLKNFFNAIFGNDTIFSREDIKNMSTNEFLKNESSINYQLASLGIPSEKQLQESEDVVYVKSYTKDDGTHVKAHYRSKPDDSILNNLKNLKNEIGQKINDTKESVEKNVTYSTQKGLLWCIEHLGGDNIPDAKELLNIFVVGVNNNEKTDKYTAISSDKTKNINNVLGIQNNPTLKINNSWSGLRFANDSRLSKNLSNSSELQNQVKDYCQKHKNLDNARIGVSFSKDKNLSYSIAHGTIFNPSVDKKGNFSGLLFDKYDFASQYLKYEQRNPEALFLNEAAVIMQNNKWGHNYYLLIPVKFKL